MAANRFGEALTGIEKWHRANDWPGIWVLEAYVYSRSGKLPEARRLLAEYQHADVPHRNDPTGVPSAILISIAANQKDKALAEVQRAFLERSNALTGLKVDPMYDPLRSDPRFQDLLRRVGLAN